MRTQHITTSVLNADINELSLDQQVYQPNAAERAALAAAGYSGFPLSGANASNTPFPSWRCIANALLADEPAEKCNGLITRGDVQLFQVEHFRTLPKHPGTLRNNAQRPQDTAALSGLTDISFSSRFYSESFYT